ncbi:hypothetical protein EDB83DRAFT_2365601 [Lactarius deliciosus]|nr:hypothetical protein EDB83DRAFT_2365601 [Lactarius deliciosus]
MCCSLSVISRLFHCRHISFGQSTLSPSMAHYDVFRRLLAIHYPAYGHALWEPDPGSLGLPVAVGDVGYVREGKFFRLFNALLPKDHPSHSTFGVPEHYEQLQVPHGDHIVHGTLSSNHFCSAGVTLGPDPEALANRSKINFLCTRQQGAVLYLPVQARSENTVALVHFGKWMIEHIGSWFSWARRLALGVNKMEDIILVTGCHRTRTWVNIVFPGGSGDASVFLDVNFDADRVRFDLHRERSRGALINMGPSGVDLPEDQCIFIRGFRVTRKFKILPRLKGAAEPKPDPRGNDREPDMEVVPNVAKDPLHLLLEYLANRAPPCDMVLVHDDDLERILGADDGTVSKGNV